MASNRRFDSERASASDGRIKLAVSRKLARRGRNLPPAWNAEIFERRPVYSRRFERAHPRAVQKPAANIFLGQSALSSAYSFPDPPADADTLSRDFAATSMILECDTER
jgi:hypothetical protein